MPPRPSLSLTATVERFPIAGAFVISRGARTTAEVVVATVSDGAHAGRGECVPYARYGETVDGVREAILTAAPALAAGLDRDGLQKHMPAGAARNALDCALWDLAARSVGRSAADLAGIGGLVPLTTCYTLSLAAPEAMAAKARTASAYPLLKLKLGGAGDADRLKAVRAARPDARLVADANEAWTAADLPGLMAVAAEIGLECLEQPLPASDDGALATIARPVPVCADEAVHTAADLPSLTDRYDAVNIKLDKAGGLTGALVMRAAARAAGLKVMVGCMVGTSLAMAPAVLAAQGADWVDLDGPLLLARDRSPGLRYDGAVLHPPLPELWG